MIRCAGPRVPGHERGDGGWIIAGIRFLLRRGVVSLAAAALLPAHAAAGPAAIRWRVDAVPLRVEVEGIPDDVLQALQGRADDTGAWARMFAVYAEPNGMSSGAAALPAMAGAWQVGNGRLIFVPLFPLTPGVRYRAEYHAPKGPPVVAYHEPPPPPRGAPTRVVQVYPSADVLPENQLKFYVQFSAPMSRGGMYRQVRVRDSAGSEIELPFLDLDEELWDPSMTRLTLLIDPGRIKRGVKPLEDMGPVFEEGKTYSLLVDGTCLDAAGQPLGRPFEKKFRVGPADRQSPDPRRWAIAAPRAGTRAPLGVAFDEPMDQALALRLIDVLSGTEGNAWVPGEPALLPGERTWRFTPESPWSRGEYRLAVATTIEDLAGNNIGKTFDVDLAAGAPSRVGSDKMMIVFRIE